MKALQQILCAIFCLAVSAVGAQNITQYRYWFDDDASGQITAAISPSGLLDLDQSMETLSAVGAGHHSITFQFQDNNGNWSVPYTKKFLQNGALDMLEYWIDDDIAASTTQPLAPGNIQNIETSLDVSSLSPGFHRLTVRSSTSYGMSSVPQTVHFKVGGGELVSWEYWFDDDLATRIQQSIAPAQADFQLMDNLNTANLNEGPHVVTWRSESGTGNFSAPVTYAFNLVLSAASLDGVESILVYPSPARENLTIKLDANKNLVLNVELYAASGKLIYTNSNALTTAQNLFNLDVADLAPGIYILQFSNSDGAVSHRFVKE